MPRPDDRSDNVAKLQEHIENTFENLREARERLRADARDLPEDQEEAIRLKNRRRREAIEGFRQEIRDEVDDRREAGAADAAEAARAADAAAAAAGEADQAGPGAQG